MDHIRIDEGVKRKYPQRAPRNPRNEAGQYLPLLPRAQPEAIKQALEEFQQGALLADLAERHGVSIQAVYSWLLGNLGGAEHDRLVTEALTARIAKADEALDAAPNPLELARAREQCRNSRLDFERRRPNLYGPKQEIAHTGNPVLNITVVAAPQIAPQHGVLIDQQPDDDAK